MVPLIVLVYYDRPNMVQNALKSFEAITVPFQLAVIDDGSKIPFDSRWVSNYTKAIAVWQYNSRMSVADKVANGGSIHGKLINEAILQIPSDLVIVVCDDDAIVPGAVEQLCAYYTANPNVMYSYSHVRVFNPLTEKPEGTAASAHWLNQHRGMIAPSCNVDNANVTFRTQCIIDGVRYPWPETGALDAAVFGQLTARYGLAPFNGIILQYKGIYSGQMTNRPDIFTPIDSGAV